VRGGLSWGKVAVRVGRKPYGVHLAMGRKMVEVDRKGGGVPTASRSGKEKKGALPPKEKSKKILTMSTRNGGGGPGLRMLVEKKPSSRRIHSFTQHRKVNVERI